MSDYTVDVPALAAMEGGRPVTATIAPRGRITYEVDDGESDGGGKKYIDEQMPYDGMTAAHLVSQLRLVQAARRACEALMDARERMHAAYDAEDGPGDVGDAYNAECGRAETALAQASVEYEHAMTALPHSLL